MAQMSADNQRQRRFEYITALGKMGERAFVGARRVDDASARRPEVLLVIERDDADIRHRNFGCLLQKLLAFAVIDGGERLIEQRIHLRIGIAPTVRLAHAFVGAERGEQGFQRR
jgi:hypothetical protein